VKQVIHKAINDGINPSEVLYASIDTPIYAGMALEKFLELLPQGLTSPKLVCFDEIQYLKNWEVHLKDLVDAYPTIKFIATGSAAAALKLASDESGAGRFSEFVLPPLTFHEFLMFSDLDDDLIEQKSTEPPQYEAKDLDGLNKIFIDYLNYGGYPEAVLNETVREQADQLIRNDIIDKVLLKDLPNLYGIKDIQELNKLFSVLAYNTGQEVSPDNIAQTSGISKPTIKRYIEYLESALLIIKVPTVNENCKSLKRERNFKVYLNNPSMRAALFAPVTENEPEKIGHLAESAIYAQWQHSSSFRMTLRYARWKNAGEVDIVYLHPSGQKPSWIGEVKWNDRVKTNFTTQTKNLKKLLDKHKSITSAFMTTRTYQAEDNLSGRRLSIKPCSLYCYGVGRNITRQINSQIEVVSQVESSKTQEKLDSNI